MGKPDTTVLISAVKRHWDELINRGSLLHYKPGQFIFYQDHRAVGAYLLCKGKIRLTKSDDPTFQKEISADAQPIVGMDFLMTGDKYIYSAQAVTNAELCYLPKSEVLLLLSRS